MTTIDTSIDLDLPVRSVYNQWTQFEEFPEFMAGVESVTQQTDSSLHWVAEIAGVRREWNATITEQTPDQVIAWRSTDGPTNAGRVSFESLDAGRTRVSLRMEFEPENLVEKAGDALGIVRSRVEGDLERFKKFLEERGAETGEWRGEIHGGKTVKLEDDSKVQLEPGNEVSSFPTDRGSTPPPARGTID